MLFGKTHFKTFLFIVKFQSNTENAPLKLIEKHPQDFSLIFCTIFNH